MKYYSLSKKITEKNGMTIYRLFEDDVEILKLSLPIQLNFITDDIVLFKKENYGDSIEKKKAVLFSLKEGKVLSDEFNEIEAFNEEKIARANIYLKSGSKLIIVSCFIDIEGNIISDIVDSLYKIPFKPKDYATYLNYLEDLKKAVKEEDDQFEALVNKSKEKINKLSLKR